jgi:cytochrome c biogenesis protein CcmG/thiol:disulfide interchange protein DsbE
VKLSSAILLVAGLAVITLSCSHSEPKVSRKAVNPAQYPNLKPAPSFSLKDENGATVTLADYQGKVLLLNFWATWCGPCKIEIPWFMEFEKQYKNRGFEVLGVAMDDDGWKAVKPYVADHKFNYRVVLGNDSVATSYGGIDALPTTFVITPNGKILTSHVGLVNREDYVKEIESLLDANTTTTQSRFSGGPRFALLSISATR